MSSMTLQEAAEELRHLSDWPEELQQFIWGLRVLHGTWRDAFAPKGFVPPFWLAEYHLRRAGMTGDGGGRPLSGAERDLERLGYVPDGKDWVMP